MLKIIESFNHLPSTYYIDDSIRFLPGQISSLKVKDNQTVATISDGINPFGVFDDIKSPTCRKVSIREKVELPLEYLEYTENYRVRFKKTFSFQLNNSNIVAKSFYIHDSIRSPISNDWFSIDIKNGILTIPSGTVLWRGYNFPEWHQQNFPFEVSYAYHTKFSSLENSVSLSNRVTVWNNIFIGETDMFDTSSDYYAYQKLYSNNGLFTSQNPVYESKKIGVVLKPPSSKNPTLTFLFDLNNKVDIGEHKNNIKLPISAHLTAR